MSAMPHGGFEQFRFHATERINRYGIIAHEARKLVPTQAHRFRMSRRRQYRRQHDEIGVQHRRLRQFGGAVTGSSPYSRSRPLVSSPQVLAGQVHTISAAAPGQFLIAINKYPGAV